MHNGERVAICPVHLNLASKYCECHDCGTFFPAWTRSGSKGSCYKCKQIQQKVEKKEKEKEKRNWAEVKEDRKKVKEEKKREERDIREGEKQAREEKNIARRSAFWSEGEPQDRAKKLADLAAAIAFLNTAGPHGYDPKLVRFLLPHEVDKLIELAYTDIHLAENIMSRDNTRDVIVALYFR